MRGRPPTALAAEIDRRMRAAGMNPKSLSRAAGVGETYISDILKGRSKNPKFEHVMKVAEALDCTLDDLGYQPMPQIEGIARFNVEQVADDGLRWAAPIREVDTYVGMGSGGLMDEERTVGVWQLPAEWLRAELRSSDFTRVCVVTLEGDSMGGTLSPGDKVIIDLNRRTPSPPGLFVVWDGLAQVAKRLEYVEGSDPPSVRVISDNPHYRAYERTLDEVHIVGRIMGRWQRLS
jgi:phage repressor protein C with HTH and peptisase S24 domain